MKYGQVQLSGGHTFKWTMEPEATIPEVCGWIELPRGGIMKDTYGWYRTADPIHAARIAASNFNLECFQ